MITKEKLVTAEEAIRKIKSGDKIVIGHACGEPQMLTKALSHRISELKDVTTLHMVGMGESAYCREEATDHVRHCSLFVGGRERKAVAEGRADYVPIYFSEIPGYLCKKLKVDVALIQVSPPDKHGYVSLGISVDYTLAVAKSAEITIAQVNEQMPRTHGDSFLHVSDIDVFVIGNEPIIELPQGKISEIDMTIGKHCADLIDNGAVLQLGIGSLPDAVLSSLFDKKDLGLHTEMFSDGAIPLIEQGIINNRSKKLLPGKSVASFLMGSRALYNYVDDNPAVYMGPVDFVNDPYVISQNDHVVSINSCVQVDLFGQVCSTSVGLKQISGVGGQVDFVRGANLSKNGVSIIAIASTAKDGTVSKIVPYLDEGAAVTTNRYDVMYIVTEFGSVNLQGLSLKDRARALIDLAHPDFRESLAEEYERRFKHSFC
jgi:4-hydroxybutyrate CoA-transferase